MPTTRRTSSSTSSITPRVHRRDRRSRSSLFSRRPVSRFASSLRLLAGIACVAAIAACDLGTVNVAPTTPTMVVHGVLNPSANDQIILVERTLTGAIDIPDSQHFDAADPIVTAGGVPIRDANVEIID